LPLGIRSESLGETVVGGGSLLQYVVTDFGGSELRLDASRFYEASYRPTLRQMIRQVVHTEAPIYEDLIVERIARAHGFQRSGNNIHQIIDGLIDREFPRSRDNDRIVVWSSGMQTNAPAPYRRSLNGARSHTDIPISELASLATPYVRLRMNDEDVLRQMAEHFQLGRLREATRVRFGEALKLAQKWIR
jgi:hypothetical protein